MLLYLSTACLPILCIFLYFWDGEVELTTSFAHGRKKLVLTCEDVAQS